MENMGTISLVLQTFTALGVIVTIAALSYQIHKDRIEKIWEQSGKISCWVLEKDNRIRNSGQVYRETVIISNSSNEPVYDVVLSIETVKRNKVISRMNMEFPDVVACVPPGLHMAEAEWTCPEQYSNFNVAIYFRDARGRCWYRDATGVLKEHDNILNQEYDSQFFYVPIREYKP